MRLLKLLISVAYSEMYPADDRFIDLWPIHVIIRVSSNACT